MADPLNPPVQIEVRLAVFSLFAQQLQMLLLPSTEALPGGDWQLPGAVLRADRSLEETAQACLARLVPPSEFFLEQLYTYGEVDRHPHQRVISVAYFALIPQGETALLPGNPGGVIWHPAQNLPALVLDQDDIFRYALRRLRYKIEYSAAGFELLPNQFSLSELQHTYEIVLGEKLDKRNFRRRILEAGIIEPTDCHRTGEGRPARLYRYRPDAVAEVKARRLFP